MAAVKITESKLELFQVPQTYALAHEVDSTFTPARGSLAWQFSLIFGDVDELRQRRVTSGNCAVLEHNSRFVYYLVTKANAYGKSTYDDVQAALICMREHMRNHEITKVALPRICCGSDELDWKQVKRIMQQVFAHNECTVELLICGYNEVDLDACKCQINESRGDLFTAPNDFALVHSVSADFAMCSGVDLQFKCKFSQTDELKKQNRHIGNVAVVEQSGRYIYNLITKERFHEKCTYTALYYALLAMREHMRAHHVSKLAIPRLGCGIDRLDWQRVHSLLELVFAEDTVEIVAFFYEPPKMQQDTLQVTCPTCHHMKIMQIPRSTHSSRLSLCKEKSPF